MTRALLEHLPELGGRILEPCSGEGAIASVLAYEGRLTVVTNDFDPRRPADFHLDASHPGSWDTFGPIDWVVSNPPYVGHLCLPIVRLAVEHARVGVALMLRLSFIEPTAKGQRRRRTREGRILLASEPRGPWLAQHPLSRLLVLPRHSFTGAGSDSVTTAWCIWARIPLSGPPHVSIYHANDIYREPWRGIALRNTARPLSFPSGSA